MKKILVIFGTRPEAIKMAPLVKALQNSPHFIPIICVTAQHRGMLDQVLANFSIRPDYDLNIMKPSQTLSEITTNAMLGIEDIIKKEQPDLTLVHGDTTTALAGCLASFYQNTPIGHVEAGLRTYNKYSPFPEEINRQLIDNMADLMFAPTKESAQNLNNGKLNQDQKVFITGNTAIDALSYTVRNDYQHPVLDWAADSRMILLTAHRRENLGAPMRSFFKALARIVNEFPDVKVIYPVHLNPIVQNIAQEELGNNERIKLISPLETVDFHNFMKKSYLILSDSGGVQEEAPSLGKPVLVLRNNTERPEGIAAGTLKLIGTNTDQVYSATKELLTNQTLYNQMSQASNPYGDGHASENIVKYIHDYFKNQEES